MVALVGRDSELKRIADVLASSKDGRLMRSIRLVGASGMGKTALATAVAEQGRGTGWLVVWTTSYRLHAAIPLFAARRIVTTITAALGDASERYTSGLSLDNTDPAVFEEAFFRFIEGVSLDHPLLLVVDDAQWSDETSRALLIRTVQFLADRPIVLFSAERSDLDLPAAFDLPDVVIPIDHLNDAAIAGIVRDRYPNATDEVVDAIVEHGGGRAVDVVALAEAARDNGTRSSGEVEKSMRRVVARDLATLDTEMRTLLQICSLLDEPIEPQLLASFWLDGKLLRALGHLPRRYLIEDADGLRFVHASIMEAVRETIPIEIPLRRRIIEALLAIEQPTVETIERIVDQAQACGDRALQRQQLLALADAASLSSLFMLEAGALARALQLIPASREELLPLYTRLTQVYNGLGLERETIDACRYALHRAEELGIRVGIGGLAASLIVALWHAGRYDEAESEISQYMRSLHDTSDCAQLLSVEGYIAAHQADGSRGAAAARALEALSFPSPFLRLRLETTRAFLASREGDSAKAIASIRNAQTIVASLPPITRTLPHGAQIYHTFLDSGVDAIWPLLQRQDVELNGYYVEALRAASLLSRGEFEGAETSLGEALVRFHGSFGRRALLSVASALAAFQQSPLEADTWLASRDEREAYERSDSSTILVPIVTGWAVAFSAAEPKRAKEMIEILAERWAEPFDFAAFSFPVLLVISARNAGATGVLQSIARGKLYSDKQRWSLAQDALARGAALAFLDDETGDQLLRRASDEFNQMSAPYFARYAESLIGKKPPQAAPSVPAMYGTATRREREVAALVAEGLTNREIAEKLVLSERTVEGHIANLFAKVNVGSRTQLAAWYLRATNSVA